MTKHEYNPVTDAVVAELRQIVGESYVIYEDVESLEPFSRDEVPDPHYRHMPDVVVRPDGAEEIQAIMKLANRLNIPVTPRGAGSGLSGGAVPIYGGIVLSIDRMNRILEIDRENMVAVLEPGVVTSEINERTAEFGLFYAGYPMSLETCYIGGNVAENAGGAKAVKYGVTGRYVLGLDVVTPTGELIELGGKLVKDVTGYNVLQLMLGSEGTLGIFTKIVLKLLPAPSVAVDLLCLFPTAEQAVTTVPKLMTESGITPTAIEFMDRASVAEACGYLNETLPYEDAGAMLLITLDGTDVEQVERDYEAIGELCLAGGASEVYVADNRTTHDRIWKVRHSIGEAFSLYSNFQANEDIVVPMAAVAKLVAGTEEISKRYGVLMPTFGHAGDGNLHIRLTPGGQWPEEKWRKILPDVQRDLYELTASLGGRLSGEHGIGHKRKKDIGVFLSPATIDVMKSIKRAMDPNNILNPGKIFDM